VKLLYFNDYRVGVLDSDGVVDVTTTLSDIPCRSSLDLMSGLIERFDDYRPRLEKEVRTGVRISLAGIRFRAPLPRPDNIDCMALNYMEDGTRKERPPIDAFHKSRSAVIGDGETMVLPDEPATIFEGEAEVAVVIGRRAANIRREDAMAHVFGYMNFIDGSARGLPTMGNALFQIKSRDTFAPMGPYIVTRDEVPDPQSLQVKLWVNGVLKQNFNTSDMAYDIPRSIEWLSTVHALEPGDIVATGTNHRGLSAFQDGDLVEMETEGLGRLHVRIRDDLKRTWARETRFERAQKTPGASVVSPQLTGKYAVKPS
jgi:2-keto-4-pentenoate hydratase/2-oxohepta-3-ene-1,7-dioic acid hydratase in catechol pathway